MSQSDNIRVLTRFRPPRLLTTPAIASRRSTHPPPNNSNSNYQPPNIIDVSKHIEFEDSTITLTHSHKQHTFAFDGILRSDCSQEQCYNTVATDIVTDVLNGYNGCIFAYGQTGSGKTYSMSGVVTDDGQGVGIIPRCCTALFDGLRQSTAIDEVTVKVTYLEIYMESLRDRLTHNTDKLKLREDSINNDVYVDNLSSVYVSSVDDVMQCVATGNERRVVATTGMNESSSRSHSVFTLEITQKLHSGQLKCSKLSLVDLAGSEKVSRTGASGVQLEQAKHINKSLSALGNVISALTDNTRDHVPYRDSALTFLLKNSLGGNCKTCILINCSPDKADIVETLSTLQFGKRAKAIKTNAVVNVKLSAEQLQKQVNALKNQLQHATKHIGTLQSALRAYKDDSPAWSVNSDKLLQEGLIDADDFNTDFNLNDTSVDDSTSECPSFAGISTPNSPHTPNRRNSVEPVSAKHKHRSSLSSESAGQTEWQTRCVAAEETCAALQERLAQLMAKRTETTVSTPAPSDVDPLADKLTQTVTHHVPSTVITPADAQHILDVLAHNKQLEIQQSSMQKTWSQYIDLVMEETKAQQQSSQQQIQQAIQQYESSRQAKFVKPMTHKRSGSFGWLKQRTESYDKSIFAITGATVIKQWLVREKVFGWLQTKWQRRSLELTSAALFLYTLSADSYGSTNDDKHLPETDKLCVSVLLDEHISIKRVEYSDKSLGVVLHWQSQNVQLKCSSVAQVHDIVDTLTNSFKHSSITTNDILDSTHTNGLMASNTMLEHSMHQRSLTVG